MVKSFASPPHIVKDIGKAICYVFGKNSSLSKDNPEDYKIFKALLNDPQFIGCLRNFDPLSFSIKKA